MNRSGVIRMTSLFVTTLAFSWLGSLTASGQSLSDEATQKLKSMPGGIEIKLGVDKDQNPVHKGFNFEDFFQLKFHSIDQKQKMMLYYGSTKFNSPFVFFTTQENGTDKIFALPIRSVSNTPDVVSKESETLLKNEFKKSQLALLTEALEGLKLAKSDYDTRQQEIGETLREFNKLWIKGFEEKLALGVDGMEEAAEELTVEFAEKSLNSMSKQLDETFQDLAKAETETRNRYSTVDNLKIDDSASLDETAAELIKAMRPFHPGYSANPHLSSARYEIKNGALILKTDSGQELMFLSPAGMQNAEAFGKDLRLLSKWDFINKYPNEEDEEGDEDSPDSTDPRATEKAPTDQDILDILDTEKPSTNGSSVDKNPNKIDKADNDGPNKNQFK